MDSGKFKCIMFAKVQILCDRIKEYFNIDYNEALKLLYNSKIYSALEDEKIKMWYYSNYDLFMMFVEEYNTGKYTVYGG